MDDGCGWPAVEWEHAGATKSITDATVDGNDLVLTMAENATRSTTVTFSGTQGWCEDSSDLGGIGVNAECVAVTNEPVTKAFVLFESAMALVNGYFEAGVLHGSQARQMLTHLSVAERLATDGLAAPARRVLDRFAAVAARVSDDEARTELLAIAEALKIHVSGTP